MAKIRIGILGAGTIARGAHLPSYKKHEACEVVALADSRVEVARQVASSFGIPRVYEDYKELLDQPDIDAVSVCLPVSLHAPASIAALRRGKHVLCEKPLAIDSHAAQEIVDAVKESGQIHMMAMNNRYRPESRYLKQRIEKGELGAIYHGKAAWVRRRTAPTGADGWYLNEALSGGGALIDCGIHGLDLMWWLMGCPKPTSVSASTYWEIGIPGRETKGRPKNIEEFATLFIRFNQGQSAQVDAGWNLHMEPEMVKNVRVFGDKGGAELPPLKLYRTDGDMLVNENPQYAEAINYQEEVSAFIRSVQTGEEPLSPPRQGVTVLKIIEAAYRSAHEGHEVSIE